MYILNENYFLNKKLLKDTEKYIIIYAVCRCQKERKARYMKLAKRLFAVLLCAVTVFAAIPFAVTATTDEYAQSLRDAGFPEDYIDKLCELHDLHPNWKFIPDNITQLSRDYGTSSEYTWDYVIAQETADDENNIIWETTTDAAYVIDFTPVESGHWYRASVDAVKFFMDPRNFLNEYDIFQFEKLGYNDSMTVPVVESILNGTFMYDTVIPDEGNTQKYSEYIIEVAKELDLSAIQIASRLRMEQGVDGTNPLISGTCGTTLYEYYTTGSEGAPSTGYTEAELKVYDGYYNYFNMDAWGTGHFEIYLRGMNEAVENGWTTRKAAISGGAAKFKARYIDNYQYTPYYFKYNVHAGAADRNFWGQYMQAVDGSWDDGRSMQKAYRNHTLLDNEHIFYIPVYEGMPTAVCEDPGTEYRVSETYRVCIDTPSVGMLGEAAKITDEASFNGTYYVDGWSVHTEGVYIFQYSVDGGSFLTLPGSMRADVTTANSDYTHYTTVNAFNHSIPLEGLAVGTHNIVIRGVTELGNRYLIADITLNVTEKYEEITVNSADSNMTLDKTDYTLTGITAGTDAITLMDNLSGGKLLDKEGNEISSGILVSGLKLCGYDSTGTVRETYTVIVKNDVYADGVVNSKDVLMSKILNTDPTADGYVKAADTDGDGTVSASELKELATQVAAD